MLGMTRDVRKFPPVCSAGALARRPCLSHDLGPSAVQTEPCSSCEWTEPTKTQDRLTISTLCPKWQC